MDTKGIKSLPITPGLVALFGSGETSASGHRVYDSIFSNSSQPVRVAILETPAGFQPNSAQVAQKIGDFLRNHLQNYQPDIDIVPARRRGSPSGTDDIDILTPVVSSTLVFLGPGSPTYAVRHLKNSLAWHTVRACHRQGAALVLASAATIAAGVKSLPVYEIYKAGEDLHWRPGLDLFGPYGLSLVFIPHWNNKEGGSELDTSRCYMGHSRFKSLLAMLPSHINIVGIDEHTALLMNLFARNCRVIGQGTVTLIRNGKEDVFKKNSTFEITELGLFHPIQPQNGLPPDIWARVKAAKNKDLEVPPIKPSSYVLMLVESREKARAHHDWENADALREEVFTAGWEINDTTNGPQLVPKDRVK